MLVKLFKLDFKWVYQVLPYYLLGLLFAFLLNLVCFHLPKTPITSFILTYIAPSLITALTISGLINLLIRTIIRFAVNFYGDESYLTHTLPVEKSTLFHSKILVALTTVPVALLVIFFAICAENLEFTHILTSYFDFLKATPLASILAIFTVFLEFAFIYLCSFTGILLGHRAASGKKLRSALYILGLYFGSMILFFLTLYLLGFLFPSLAANFSSDATAFDNLSSIRPTLITSAIFYTIANLILYFLGKKTFAKGVNVE